MYMTCDINKLARRNNGQDSRQIYYYKNTGCIKTICAAVDVLCCESIVDRLRGIRTAVQLTAT